MASAETTVHPTDEPDDSPFVRSVVGWIALMIVLIGGISFAGITAATGSWTDGAIVAGFLATFIAPALGGLFAGVLWADRQERNARCTSPWSRQAPRASPSSPPRLRLPPGRRPEPPGLRLPSATPCRVRSPSRARRARPTARPPVRPYHPPGQGGPVPARGGGGSACAFRSRVSVRPSCSRSWAPTGTTTWTPRAVGPGPTSTTRAPRRRRVVKRALLEYLRRERARPDRVPEPAAARERGGRRWPGTTSAATTGGGRQLHHRRHREDHDGGQDGARPARELRPDIAEPRWCCPSPRTRRSTRRRTTSTSKAVLGARRHRAPGRPTSARWPRACDDRTILLVGSAVSYAHGVVDPIPELGQLALERGRPAARRRLHRRVRAAVLPAARRAGDRLRLLRAGRDVDLDGLPQVRLLPQGRVGHPVPRRRAAAPPALRQGGVDRVHRDQHDVPEHQVGRRRWPPTWAVLNYVGDDGYLEIARPDARRRRRDRGRGRRDGGPRT